MGWQAVRQEENAKRIASIGRVLYERALKFSEHLVDVGKHLERSVNAFNGAVGSYETKLLPQGRKLKDEASLTGAELEEIPRSTSCRARSRRSMPARRTNDVPVRSSSGLAMRRCRSIRPPRFKRVQGVLHVERWV